MDTVSRLRIQMTVREDWGEEPYTQIWDIKERLLDLLLGFGNGIWVEIRIVPETQEGLDAIRGLLTKGGYKSGGKPDTKATLFQKEDECWVGFVFLDTHPKSLLQTI